VVDIDDDDDLYRRVVPYHIKPNLQVSSAAFKDKRGPLRRFSVDLARLTTPEESLRPMPHFRLIAFRALTPRRLGFTVTHEPESGNYAHCNVEGVSSDDSCSQLAAESWLVEVQSASRY